MNIRPTHLLAACALVLLSGPVRADHLHITYEPQKIYQLSSKTEGAWTTCQMCQGKVRYERTWKRDHSDGSWIETTKCRPMHCRKCESKIRELDKYRAEEARLDLKLAKKAIKSRISAKKALLRN